MSIFKSYVIYQDVSMMVERADRFNDMTVLPNKWFKAILGMDWLDQSQVNMDWTNVKVAQREEGKLLAIWDFNSISSKNGTYDQEQIWIILRTITYLEV